MIRRRFPWDLVLVAALALTVAAHAPADDEIRLGYFYPSRAELSRAEIRAAFDLWAEQYAVDSGLRMQLVFYDDIEAMRRDFLSLKVNAIDADGMTLARHFRPDELAGGYAAWVQHGYDLLLLTTDGSNVADVKDVAGKRLALVQNEPVATAFMETLCLRHFQQECGRVLGEIQQVANAGQAVMRVFFGKSDLVLVPRHSYELAAELNPQVRQKVKRLLGSLPMTSVSFAFSSPQLDPALRKRSVLAATRLHESKRGRQILDLYRLDRLTAAEPAQLEPFYQLRRDHDQYRAQVANRGKAP